MVRSSLGPSIGSSTVVTRRAAPGAAARLLGLGSDRIQRRTRAAYAFLAPALVVYGVFMVFPFGHNIFLSLFDWNGLSRTKDFVGLGNYAQLLGDDVFWLALGHNLTWALLGTVVPLALGLLLAMLLQDRPPGYTLFRTIFFIPQVLAPVVVAILFSWIYDPTFGILSRTLESIGLGVLARPWLADPDSALFALIAVAVWVETGFAFIIFLAALQEVDADLLDSAKMDGANAWQSFVHVTVPQIANAVTLVGVSLIIAGFNAFDYVWVMTKGGPANGTELTSTYLYEEAFRNTNVGYGATIATVSTVITLIVSVVVVRIRERGAR